MNNFKTIVAIIIGLVACVFIITVGANDRAQNSAESPYERAEKACISQGGVPIKEGSAGRMTECQGM